jgi:hypothetical protein
MWVGPLNDTRYMLLLKFECPRALLIVIHYQNTVLRRLLLRTNAQNI